MVQKNKFLRKKQFDASHSPDTILGFNKHCLYNLAEVQILIKQLIILKTINPHT